MKSKLNKWKGCLALLIAVQMLLLSGCGATDDYTVELTSQDSAIQTTTGSQAADSQTATDLQTADSQNTVVDNTAAEVTIDKDGIYASKDDVALYLHIYGELPDNFITKKEAQALGWSGGSLELYAPGKCIGGDKFGNYEGILPDDDYHECDIDTLGAKSRGAKRIVYSDDGDIYYTEDHYESFELLYGGE